MDIQSDLFDKVTWSAEEEVAGLMERGDRVGWRCWADLQAGPALLPFIKAWAQRKAPCARGRRSPPPSIVAEWGAISHPRSPPILFILSIHLVVEYLPTKNEISIQKSLGMFFPHTHAHKQVCFLKLSILTQSITTTDPIAQATVNFHRHKAQSISPL